MKIIYHITAVFFLLAGSVSSLNAQSYDYEYEVDTYTELSGDVVIEVPAEGFFMDLNNEKFLCYSEIYKANSEHGLKISREGSFQLTNGGTKATFLFSGGFVLRDDTEISYLIEGEKKDTNRVIKVQYKNAGFNYGEEDEYINFQIWVYPNTGDFESHVGSYLVNTNGSSYSTGSSAWGPATGVIRMDTSYNFIEIITVENDPSNPQVRRGNFTLLGSTPVEGAILKFKNQAPPIDHSVQDDDDDDDDGTAGNGGSQKDWPIGIASANNEEAEINVYPNPASDYVTIDFNSNSIKTDPILFQVYSIQGQLIKEFSIDPINSSTQLNVQDWPSGVYFIINTQFPKRRTRLAIPR